MIKHSAPPLQVQLPLVQPFAVSESQARPQAPQLLRLLLTFVQVPEQQESVPGQVSPHAPQFAGVSSAVQRPPQHDWPPAQRTPPQRHMPITHVSPAPHVGEQVGAAQVPAWQVCPAEHIRPQAPQWLGLLFMSTQPPEQQELVPVQAAPAPQRHAPPVHVSPVSHAGVHALPQEPAMHVVPTSQRMPHMPQWFELFVTSTHAPPQHIWLPLQAGRQVLLGTSRGTPVSSPPVSTAGASMRPVSRGPASPFPSPPDAQPTPAIDSVLTASEARMKRRAPVMGTSCVRHVAQESESRENPRETTRVPKREGAVENGQLS
jgi:hypothetical protein